MLIFYALRTLTVVWRGGKERGEGNDCFKVHCNFGSRYCFFFGARSRYGRHAHSAPSCGFACQIQVYAGSRQNSAHTESWQISHQGGARLLEESMRGCNVARGEYDDDPATLRQNCSQLVLSSSGSRTPGGLFPNTLHSGYTFSGGATGGSGFLGNAAATIGCGYPHHWSYSSIQSLQARGRCYDQPRICNRRLKQHHIRREPAFCADGY